ncbi:transporter substrate-binding domain-containing protein [Anaerobacillus sp. 1_MG-2023]|uniref:transporter substrate-binding domain-containing protein n=1 Tax=Anaerobacillus sp. 1_MG-2023 TaxID=3062655 RepID=UPI0026E1C644|nr:transporter substrate-binding domain-containing protein [Anaerobacillus sp. 1_MG-2023]MDO6655199.1 transporter substrate-binding domain-containing protein [Anaerobacillus sp. 1_MG-2023]
MKKNWLMIIGGLFMVMALVACGSSNENSNEEESGGSSEETLIMGTSADYPPFEYIDSAKGEDIIGFDVDIANYIADELGYNVEIKDMDFSGLITALSSERVDFVLAGMTPTDERKENVDFSEIYYSANHMIVSSSDNKMSKPEDLDGAKVGVQLGSIQEDKANELKDSGINMEIITLNRIPELIQELKSGRYDAIIIEDTVAKGYLESNEDLTGENLPNTEEAGSAVAFPKDSELTEEFDEVIKEMKENGKMDELIEKWFGQDTVE